MLLVESGDDASIRNGTLDAENVTVTIVPSGAIMALLGTRGE